MSTKARKAGLKLSLTACVLFAALAACGGARQQAKGIVVSEPARTKTEEVSAADVRVEPYAGRMAGEHVHERAAKSYDTYQSCGIKSARALFATGW